MEAGLSLLPARYLTHKNQLRQRLPNREAATPLQPSVARFVLFPSSPQQFGHFGPGIPDFLNIEIDRLC